MPDPDRTVESFYCTDSPDPVAWIAARVEPGRDVGSGAAGAPGERGAATRRACLQEVPVQRRNRVDAPSALEDLDSLAEQYARDRMSCSDAEQRHHRDLMIHSALPFAGRIARRYRNRGESPDDLEQVARLGLVKAVDRYDPERGSFTAYALMTITGEIKRHFRDHTWAVHLPRRLQDLGLELNQAAGLLHHELHRSPTDAELAAHCDVAAGDVAAGKFSAAGYRSASLNTPIGDGGAELGDLFGAPDPGVGLVDDRLTASRLIARLPYRQRRLLMMRFYGNLSQAEIAAEFGISQMHVSRLLARTLTWLRETMLNDAVPRWPAADDGDDSRLDITATAEESGALRVHVAGEVDRDNAPDLSDALLAVVRRTTPERAVLVDLTRVPFVDAAGIAVLVAVHEAARVREVPVTVVGLQPHVRRVVAISGLRGLLTQPPGGRAAPNEAPPGCPSDPACTTR
jgi:RNA polymerase sigma-B factor